MVRHPALPASIGSTMTNFRFIANEVLTTEETVERVRAAAAMAAR